MPCRGTPPQAENEWSRLRRRAELLRLIKMDPHLGQDTANWTTARPGECCAGYVGHPFYNEREMSHVENLARSVEKEEKI